MENLDYDVVCKIQHLHNGLQKIFDLGSTHYIEITIYKNNAVVSNSFKGYWNRYCVDKYLGNFIAETILLEALKMDKCEYGDWLHNKDLPDYKEILKSKDDEIEFNLELAKLWNVARIICNRDNADKDKKIYEIAYCENWTSVNEFDSVDKLEEYYALPNEDIDKEEYTEV